jgi:peptide deformylase
MKTNIVDKDSPILREIAKEVPVESIKTKKIQDLLKRMKIVLSKEEDGVALAAPQIGESLRIFIISGRTLHLLQHRKKTLDPDEIFDDIVFINPVITKLSKTKKKMEEGCLSIRWLYGKVERSEKATVRAYNEKGELFEKGASRLMAQIFQHEVDHLNGVLFIDKAENVENIPPEHQ